MGTQTIFKSEMLFGTNVAGSAEVRVSGGNCIAFLVGLSTFLDNVNYAARTKHTKALDSLLGESTRLLQDTDRLHIAVIAFVHNEGKALLRSECDSELSSEVRISGGNICISTNVDNITPCRNKENIATLSQAHRAMRDIRNTSAKAARRRAGISAQYYAYEHILAKLRAMERDLAAQISGITDIDITKCALSLAQEEALAKASIIVMAQGQHRIANILALLRQ